MMFDFLFALNEKFLYHNTTTLRGVGFGFSIFLYRAIIIQAALVIRDRRPETIVLNRLPYRQRGVARRAPKGIG